MTDDTGGPDRAGRGFGLFIGANTIACDETSPLAYAEEDARKVWNAFTTPGSGIVAREHATLLLGEAATADEITEAVADRCIAEPGPDDVVVVYFSGHGVARDDGTTYLGATDLDHARLERNPRSAIALAGFFHEIMYRSRARAVVLLLDCCYGGGVAAPLPPAGSLIPGDIPDGWQGRVAFLSSPRTRCSYESARLRSGVFTSCLLAGLTGGAAEEPDGAVTVNALDRYLQFHCKPGPVRTGTQSGRLVLSRPGPRERAPVRPLSARVDPSPARLTAMRGPLDGTETVIAALGESIATIPRHLDDTRGILPQLCQGLRAIGAGVIAETPDAWEVRLWHARDARLSEHVGAMGAARPLLDDGRLFDRRELGYALDVEFTGIGRSTALVVPLADDPREALVVFLAPDARGAPDQAVATMLRALSLETRGFTAVPGQDPESIMIDALRREHGRVPFALYDRRFRRFQHDLEGIGVHFQPIVKLNPRSSCHVTGFEALARGNASSAAPARLFEAAELWGDRFITELDLTMLTRATTTYDRMLRESDTLDREEDRPDLSVNVYPSSLVRRAYHQRVGEVLQASRIPDNGLVLEISERILPPDPVVTTIGDPDTTRFRDVLERYMLDHRVSFAIDDFGSGHASIAGLLRILPSYVKVDRSLLEASGAEHAIRFCCDLVTRLTTSAVLQHPKVVVEGVDEETLSTTTLARLYGAGVRYIQGYVAGRPGPSLSRLTPETRDSLHALLDETSGDPGIST